MAFSLFFIAPFLAMIFILRSPDAFGSAGSGRTILSFFFGFSLNQCSSFEMILVRISKDFALTMPILKQYGGCTNVSNGIIDVTKAQFLPANKNVI